MGDTWTTFLAAKVVSTDRFYGTLERNFTAFIESRAEMVLKSLHKHSLSDAIEHASLEPVKKI